MMTAARAIAVAIMAASTAVAMAGPNPFESNVPLSPQCEIDKLVSARLDQLGIQPAKVCSDAVFVRRAFLDVIGTLPTEAEARKFLSSEDPNKRSTLVEQMLARDEFADYWTLKWSDLLRVKAEFPINLWPNAAQAYHRWVYDSIRQNKPYDQFVRELLTSSGGNFRAPPVNFYRAMQNRKPEGIAQTVALTFMGTHAEKWPKDRLANMAKFFSLVGYKPTREWKEEIVFFDVGRASTQPAGAGWMTATFPDGSTVKADPDRDPRGVFADWLIDANNPWFARNIVNRAWCWLLGRGIIHEPDDIRPDNPPSNPELLAYLERELVASRYDMKHIYRLILNSRTYQMSSIAEPNHPGAAGFSHYAMRRLEAEVLIDALCQLTGTTETYISPIPEPFTYIPADLRSIALPDGSISSPFLETFGRPSRDTGLESERNNRPTSAQRIHMLNSRHIQSKIETGPKLQALLTARQEDPRELARALYLTTLSRYPTEEELTSVEAYFKSSAVNAHEAAVDLVWALANSVEFLYRH